MRQMSKSQQTRYKVRKKPKGLHRTKVHSNDKQYKRISVNICTLSDWIDQYLSYSSSSSSYATCLSVCYFFSWLFGDPMTETKRQMIFTSYLPLLITKAINLGFEPRLDFGKRCEDCPVNSPNSYHPRRLAVDLLLDKDGEWLKETIDYLPLGVWWEKLGGVWGGNFYGGDVGTITSGDGNHFQFGEEMLPLDPTEFRRQ